MSAARLAGRCLLAGALLFVLVVEVGSRLVRPDSHIVRVDSPPAWRSDRLLGWAMQPNYRGRLTHADFSARFSINSQGLRDREYSLARNGRKRMLVLGDSLGFGWGVEDDEVFSELIEARHADWEIINASVPGYGTDQQYLYLAYRGLLFEPDSVLVLFHENDFRNNVASQEYLFYKPYFGLRDGVMALHNSPVPGVSLVQQLDRFFYRHLHLLGRTYYALRFISTGGRQPGRTDTGGDHEVTQEIFQRLEGLADRHGFEVLIASMPMSEHDRRLFARLCRRAAISCLDLTEPLREHGGALTFPADGHWTAEGHRVAADAIAEYMMGTGLL